MLKELCNCLAEEDFYNTEDSNSFDFFFYYLEKHEITTSVCTVQKTVCDMQQYSSKICILLTPKTQENSFK